MVRAVITRAPRNSKTGPVAIDFVNESEELYFKVNLMKHTGDETIQDMIDYLGPDPATRHQPSWVRDLGTWSYSAFADSPVHWEGNLEAGTYTLVCATSIPTFAVWFGTGLIVED